MRVSSDVALRAGVSVMTPLHRLPLFYFAYSFVPLLIDDTSFSCHTRPLRL